MAEAKAGWVEAKSGVEGDSVVVDNGAISEIRSGGRKSMIKGQ